MLSGGVSVLLLVWMGWWSLLYRRLPVRLIDVMIINLILLFVDDICGKVRRLGKIGLSHMLVAENESQLWCVDGISRRLIQLDGNPHTAVWGERPGLREFHV